MKYLILYKGPITSPDASHEGWPEWFAKTGSNLIDMGSPMQHGLAIKSDGTTNTATTLNGYAIVEAADAKELQELLHDHPYLSVGDEYTIETFEIPKK